MWSEQNLVVIQFYKYFMIRDKKSRNSNPGSQKEKENKVKKKKKIKWKVGK